MATATNDADLERLANILIQDAAAKKRSLTYTQLLERMGQASEFDSPARRRMTAELLPEIARRCHRRKLPILSCLAVSATTRKPEGWFRIFATEYARMIPASVGNSDWQAFVNEEQRRAVVHWSATRQWAAQ
jgi:hypothetical protein